MSEVCLRYLCVLVSVFQCLYVMLFWVTSLVQYLYLAVHCTRLFLNGAVAALKISNFVGPRFTLTPVHKRCVVIHYQRSPSDAYPDGLVLQPARVDYQSQMFSPLVDIISLV